MIFYPSHSVKQTFLPAFSTDAQWEQISPLLIEDAGYAHTFNGSIYFVGGTAVQEFDPARGTWVIINQEGIGYQPYRGGSALIGDKIYILNGWTDHNDSTMIYDIAENTFSTFSPALYDRLDVAMGALNGILYVSGGWANGDTTPTTTTSAYNPTNDSWYSIAPLVDRRKDHEMVAIGDFLYAIGGTQWSWERYDPSINQWQLVGSLQVPWNSFGAVATMNRYLFLANMIYSHIYDFSQQKWYQGPFFPITDSFMRYGNSLAYLDGFVYSIGAHPGYLGTSDTIPPPFSDIVWRAKNSIPPSINHPGDMFFLGNTSAPISIVWSAEDDNPAFYNITMNGELIDSGIWDGGRISVNIDALSSGNYTFMCQVRDEDGDTATDSVSVFPLSLFPSTDTSPIETTKATRTRRIIPWSFLDFFFIQVVVLITLKLVMKKKSGAVLDKQY
ncbi:MAG: Kelch repeat-containing protein [Candidatus Hodarchaeales archaeon]|jgi:hypothetical protein